MKPTEIDEFLAIGAVLTFLMINYNLNLSSIYSHMAIYMIIGYLVAIMFNLFEWIPILRKGESRLKAILIGAGIGVAFIYFYKSFINIAPIGTVFATTAFGESKFLGMMSYSFLIPYVETLGFFRVLYQFIAWKFSINPMAFGVSLLVLILVIAGIFMLFHATAKGVENNTELMMTFIFAVVSLGLVVFFKQYLEALVFHFTINIYGTGLYIYVKDWLMSGAIFANMWFLLLAGIGVIWFLRRRNVLKILS